ncbi:MAG TPA: twin-arginine translocase subunit TatC [Micromonosporaceae bacterium]
MSPQVRRKRQTQFQRAADGSMTLFEHLRELRGRLFKASLGVVAGLGVGLFFADRVLNFLNKPYCDFQRQHGALAGSCTFVTNSPIDVFTLNLKVGLYIGLILAAPVWLYQLWAFIAPGLHRHERRYTYLFVTVAAPLFFAGALLAYLVVSKSLHFFLGMGSSYQVNVSLPGYFSFVTGMMLLFGAAFEFPLIIVMLNFAGLVTARRLLGWWRIAVFLMFVFGAIVTPTPDPFGMSILAGSMALLYFAAVGVAWLNDRRRAKRQPSYAGIGDDEVSPLEYAPEPVEAPEPVQIPDEAWTPTPSAVEHRYDEST